MISFPPLEALTQAQSAFDSSARKIAQGNLAPDNLIGVLTARQQVTADIRIIGVVNDLEKKLLDVLA
jgi:hypothetical protein